MEFGNIPCDLGPKVSVKGQIMYFLVIASPPKLLDVSTSNLQVHRSHDVEGTTFFMILTTRSKSNNVFIFLQMHILLNF